MHENDFKYYNMPVFPSIKSACFFRFLFFAVCLFLFSNNLEAEENEDLDKIINDRNQQVTQLLEEKKSTRDLLDELKKREGSVVDVLKTLNNNIQINQEKLNRTNIEIEDLQQEMELTIKKISRMKRQIEEDKLHLYKQLQALFYVRKIRKMTLFINTDSFPTYFRNAHLLQKNSELDAITLVRLEENLIELEEETKNQKEQNIKLVQLKKTREEQAELLEFEKQQQFTYLQHIRQDRTLRTKYLGVIQVELEKLNDVIHSLAVKKENEMKEKQFRGLYKYKYSLPSPVTGTRVHRFGEKDSRYFTLFKRGVLVETGKNEEVHSILQGKVVWSGPFHGYRNLVILDHGKGSFSVYGNLDELYVLADDVVDQSAALGTVAYDEDEQRYLFYFETRYNKQAVDPEQWLKKPVWN